MRDYRDALLHPIIVEVIAQDTIRILPMNIVLLQQEKESDTDTYDGLSNLHHFLYN